MTTAACAKPWRGCCARAATADPGAAAGAVRAAPAHSGTAPDADDVWIMKVAIRQPSAELARNGKASCESALNLMAER